MSKDSAQRFLQDLESGTLAMEPTEFEGMSEEQMHQHCLSKGYDFTTDEMFEVISDNKERLKLSEDDLSLITGGKSHLSTDSKYAVATGVAGGAVIVGSLAIAGTYGALGGGVAVASASIAASCY